MDHFCVGGSKLYGGCPISRGFREVGFYAGGRIVLPSRMAKSNKFDLETPAPVVDDEDEETLAAIDKGMRDAEAGRTVPAEEVRRLLPKWTTASSTR